MHLFPLDPVCMQEPDQQLLELEVWPLAVAGVQCWLHVVCVHGFLRRTPRKGHLFSQKANFQW